jgi:actin-related protein
VHGLPPHGQTGSPANVPTCSYSNARTSGIVVDMGASSTSVVPVQDGYPVMIGA